ncbi:hypothetical protein AB4156_39350 [Cupriavidus sp. 2MCAB6]|uniref:hypothetical protein n=1 Tax=Cupriavidus sp. 2MCAB6 TaxID=3232981 RepID=UPI003F914981
MKTVYAGKSWLQNTQSRGRRLGLIPFFLGRIKGMVNLFVIVRWELRHSGLGTYGDLYQVYAYESGKDGSLIENKNITKNSEMAGVDGYVENQVSTFRLKKASDVKDFLRWMR